MSGAGRGSGTGTAAGPAARGGGGRIAGAGAAGAAAEEDSTTSVAARSLPGMADTVGWEVAASWCRPYFLRNLYKAMRVTRTPKVAATKSMSSALLTLELRTRNAAIGAA